MVEGYVTRGVIACGVGVIHKWLMSLSFGNFLTIIATRPALSSARSFHFK